MATKDGIIEYCKKQLEREGKLPSVNKILKEFGLNTTAFYGMFPGKLPELCRKVGSPLPKQATMTKKAIESRIKPHESSEKPTDEQKIKEKQILKRLNSGVPPREIAAELGDIEFVTTIATKWQNLQGIGDYAKTLALLKESDILEWFFDPDEAKTCFASPDPIFNMVSRLLDEAKSGDKCIGELGDKLEKANERCKEASELLVNLYAPLNETEIPTEKFNAALAAVSAWLRKQ